MDILQLKIRELDTYGLQFDGMSTSMSSLKMLIDNLGPSASIAGKSIKSMMKSGSEKQLMTGFDVLHKSIEAVKLAQEGLALARAKESKSKTEEERVANARMTAMWYSKLAETMKAADKASSAIGGSIETMNAGLEKSISVIESQIELRKTDLDISQSLYGTPALAVQAQLDIVEAMQKKKVLVQEELANAKHQIAFAIAHGAKEKELVGMRQTAVDLANKAKKITAEQLRQVKELRDGYIDAVQAQAFGAGRFSKILITQEQNVMRGMQKGAIKRNFLLGQIGDESSKTKAQSYSFSHQGTGALMDASRQQLDPEAIIKTVTDRGGYRPIDVETLASEGARRAASARSTRGTHAGVTRTGEMFNSGVSQLNNVLQIRAAQTPRLKKSNKLNTSGASGNSQSKGKEASKHLQIAGRIIEELGYEVDAINDNQDNTNERFTGSSGNVQAIYNT